MSKTTLRTNKVLSDGVLPSFLVALIAFLAPWTASWARLPLQLKVAEAIAIIFLFFLTLRSLLRARIYLPPGTFPMLAVLAVSFVSLLLSPPPAKSGFEWAHGVYQPGLYNLTVLARQGFYLLLYLGVVNTCKSKRSIIKLLKGFVLGGMIAAIFGLVQATLFLLGKSTWGLHITVWDPVPRILGTFNEPGPYSDYLALVTILLFASILFKVHLFSRRVSYIFLFITGFALMLSFSSRGTLEFLLGIGYLLFTSKNKLKVLAKVLATGCIVILVLMVFCPRGFTGMKWVFTKVIAEAKLDPAKAYGGGRTGGLHIAPRIFFHHPILGIGIGNYPFSRNEFASEAGVPQVSHLDLPNNVFLEFAAETGAVGAIFLVSFMVSIFLYVFRNYRQICENVNGKLIHGLVAVCLMVLFSLTFSSALYFMHVWLLLGLLVAYVRISKKIPNQAC